MKLAERISLIKRQVGKAKLVAVTKNVDVPTIKEAISYGITAIGESRVQEAEEKLPGLSVEKHFIGHLQTNKARRAVRIFDWIQSIDSAKIASRVSDAAVEFDKTMPVLVQVNTSDKESQHGVALDEATELIQTISQLPNLDVCGLMTIADIENPRPCFKKLFQLNQDLNLPWLSMGMTDDYEIALEEGSNMIRIGRAIFG